MWSLERKCTIRKGRGSRGEELEGRRRKREEEEEKMKEEEGREHQAFPRAVSRSSPPPVSEGELKGEPAAGLKLPGCLCVYTPPCTLHTLCVH